MSILFFWINLLLELSHKIRMLHTYLYLLVLFSYLKEEQEEKEWINLLSMHVRRTTFQTKTNVQQSVTSFGFLWKKWFAYNNLVLCTYIHMYIISRCLPNGEYLRMYNEKEWMNLLSMHVRRTTFQTKTNVQQSVTSLVFLKFSI